MVEQLIVRLIGDGKSYQAMMKSAIRATTDYEAVIGRVSRVLSDIGAAFTRLGGVLTVGLTIPLVAFGVSAIKTSANMETMEKAMQVLLGSVQKGSEQFRKIQEFSIPSPFEFDELLQLNNILLQFGMSAEDAFNSMKMLDDVAALTVNPNIRRMAIAFGQSIAANRVNARDLLQFVNNGVPMLKLLQDELGATSVEIREMMRDGAITGDIMVRAFQRATSEGGMFFQGTQKMAETTRGKLAMFADQWTLLKDAMGDVLKIGFLPILERATEMTEKFRKLNPEIQMQYVRWGLILSVIGPLIAALGLVATSLSAIVALMSSWVGLIIAAIGGLAIIAKNPAFLPEESGLRQAAFNKKFGVPRGEAIRQIRGQMSQQMLQDSERGAALEMPMLGTRGDTVSRQIHALIPLVSEEMAAKRVRELEIQDQPMVQALDSIKAVLEESKQVAIEAKAAMDKVAEKQVEMAAELKKDRDILEVEAIGLE